MVRLRYNHKDKAWDEIPEGEPKTDRDIVFSRLWKKTLDRAKKDIARDLDVAILFTGEVGAGKSTMAKISCRYMSNERFNPRKHMIRKTSDIKPVIKGAKTGEDAVLFDEIIKSAAATRTMEKGTKYFNEVMDVCRQKRLFLALCAPNFHRLGSQIAIDRTKCLARIYINNKTGQRGYYAYYGPKKKEQLYRFAKSNHGSMRGCRPKYRGTFGDDLLNREVYIEMKDETLNDTLDSFDKDKPKAPNPAEIIQKFKIDLVRKHMNKPVSEVALMLDVSNRTIIRMRNVVKDELSQENEISNNEKQLNKVSSDISN